MICPKRRHINCCISEICSNKITFVYCFWCISFNLFVICISSASRLKKQQGHGFFSLTYFTDRFIFTKICCFILILLLRWFSFYPSEHIYRIFLIEFNKDIFITLMKSDFPLKEFKV